MAESQPADFPVPKFIEGGCLCGACRYRVDFPADHDVKTSSGTCQCTQCRKQTGAFFYSWHRLADRPSSFRWTTGSPRPAALRTYKASDFATREFCGTCGSFLAWQRDAAKRASFPVGTVDALYLIGEGADGKTARDGQVVPVGGYGQALAAGGAWHEYCENEIKGVTDDVPFLHRGKRFAKDEEH